jgi:hypothetical protein
MTPLAAIMASSNQYDVTLYLRDEQVTLIPSSLLSPDKDVIGKT